MSNGDSAMPHSVDRIEGICWGQRTDWRAYVQTLSSLKDLRLDTLALGLCNYAVRCGGALELHFWTLPNPMDGVAEAVARSLHGAAHASRHPNATLTGPVDGIIFSAGAHYMPNAHVGTTDASHPCVATEEQAFAAYEHDVQVIADAVASHHRGTQPKGSLGQLLPPRVVFFSQLRPNAAKKPPGPHRLQTQCAAARLNDAAARIFRAAGFATLDSFALTHGAEAHSRDTVHYDNAVVVPLAAELLEFVAGGLSVPAIAADATNASNFTLQQC